MSIRTQSLTLSTIFMCLINANNAACIFQEDYQRWQASRELVNGLAEFSEHIFDMPVSEKGFCLFHSKELDWKREMNFPKHVKRYINLCHADPEKSSITFSDVCFVSGSGSRSLDLSRLKVTKPLKVVASTFIDELSLRDAEFIEGVDFYQTRFENMVFFNNSSFQSYSFFVKCIFEKKAYFNSTKYLGKESAQYSSFNFSTFREQANFSGCRFMGKGSDANFQLIAFEDIVYFTGSVFEKRGLFSGSRFDKKADFEDVTFNNSAVFTERSDEGRLFTVRFFNAVFKKTQFSSDCLFENVEMTSANFSTTVVKSLLQFTNTKFGVSSFDDMAIHKAGRVIFAGNEKNLGFTQSVSFNVLIQKIRGYISFQCIRVAFIDEPDIKKLQALQGKEKVFFSEDCEFSIHSRYVLYTVKGGIANYRLFYKIFEGLCNWVKVFLTAGKAVVLMLEETNLLQGQIKIKVTWRRNEDFALYQKLAKYYFDSLPVHHRDSSSFFTKLDNAHFLESLLGEGADPSEDIRFELESIIREVTDYFYNRLAKSPVIELELNKQAHFIELSTEYDSHSSYEINLRLLDEDIKAALAETFISSAESSSGLPSQPNISFTFNINYVISIMKKENNITTHGSNSPVQITEGGDATIKYDYSQEAENLDVAALLKELPILVKQLQTGKLDTDQLIDLGTLNQVLKAAAENKPDKKTLIEKLKSVGSWVFTVARDIGVGYVAGILSK